VVVEAAEVAVALVVVQFDVHPSFPYLEEFVVVAGALNFVVVGILHYSNAQKMRDEAKPQNFHQIQSYFVEDEPNLKREEVEEGNAYSFVVAAVVVVAGRKGGRKAFLGQIDGIH